MYCILLSLDLARCLNSQETRVSLTQSMYLSIYSMQDSQQSQYYYYYYFCCQRQIVCLVSVVLVFDCRACAALCRRAASREGGACAELTDGVGASCEQGFDVCFSVATSTNLTSSRRTLSTATRSRDGRLTALLLAAWPTALSAATTPPHHYGRFDQIYPKTGTSILTLVAVFSFCF